MNKYTHTSIIFLIEIKCNAVVVCYNQPIPVRIQDIKISTLFISPSMDNDYCMQSFH